MSTAIINELAGFDVSTKSPEQILAVMVKKQTAATANTIALCVLAYVLIMENNYKISECADRLEVSENTVRTYSEKGRILAMSANKANAERMYHQLSPLTTDELRLLSADLITAENPAETVENASIRKQVTRRLGDNAKPEAVDKLTEGLKKVGAVQPRQITKQVADIATALEIKLPEVKRNTNTPSNASDKTPTTRDALATLESFEKDREQGSEGTEFAVSDKEAADLLKIAQVAARVLRRSGQFEQLAELGVFIEESVEMVNA